MKKVFLIVLSFICLLVSCSKDSITDVYNEFISNVNDCDSYVLKGNMEVYKDEGSDIFDMEVIYKKDSLYKVTYQNSESNSRQVLLKNSDGVYVLCPLLNKEFKFESNWPLNSSHIYILNKVVSDILEDSNYELSLNDDYYIIKSTINHKVKKSLTNQYVYINKSDKSLSKITYNTDSDEKIIFTVSSLEFNKEISSDEFDLNKIMSSETSLLGEGSTNTCSAITFSNPFDLEVCVNNNDEITIISYSGQYSYTIIYQELKDELLSSSRVYDDFVLCDSYLCFESENSLTLYLNNYVFKIISNNLTEEEMILVLNGLSIE